MASKIFISYDYSHDSRLKNMLTAWSSNSQFPLNFEDGSVDISINSHDPSAIKRAISRRMNECDIVLCIIGDYTRNSTWVDWEIEKASELRLPIVAVKKDKFVPTPDALYGKGVKWANSFKFESIKDAIKKAEYGW